MEALIKERTLLDEKMARDDILDYLVLMQMQGIGTIINVISLDKLDVLPREIFNRRGYHQ